MERCATGLDFLLGPSCAQRLTSWRNQRLPPLIFLSPNFCLLDVGMFQSPPGALSGSTRVGQMNNDEARRARRRSLTKARVARHRERKRNEREARAAYERSLEAAAWRRVTP